MTEEQINRLLELHEKSWTALVFSDDDVREYNELCVDLVEALYQLPGFAKWRVIKILVKGNDIDE